MSKIGEKPINIPQSTHVEIKNQSVTVSGKEGQLSVAIPNKIIVTKKNDSIFVKRQSNDKKTRSLHGLTRSLINNAILGVNKLWEKRLKIIGTGYRGRLQGENLVLEVGFSHPTIFKKVNNIYLLVEGLNTIIVKGIDKQLVGEVAYKIKSIKRPDPYKGKGIRYEDEKIKLKPGKKIKTVGTGIGTGK
jgi:large subunit ribosomal protein L6